MQSEPEEIPDAEHELLVARVGFPPNRGGIVYAASGWMAAIFSYSIGGSNPAELCLRRVL